MKSFDEFYREKSRNVLTAIELAHRELAEAKTQIAAKEAEANTLRAEVSRIRQERQHVENSQNQISAEIALLRQQISAIEEQIASRLNQAQDSRSKYGELSQEIKKRQTQIKSCEDNLEATRESLLSKEVDIGRAKDREMEVRLEALHVLISENFSALQDFLSQQTQREKWREMRATYESARSTDRAVMDAHEKISEIPKVLATTEVESVRRFLSEELQRSRGFLEQRFPGIFEMPTGEEPSEVAETFYWHEPADGITAILLPLPGSFWESAPRNTGDPRGNTMCHIIAAFAEALRDFQPRCERFERFIVAEVDGDRTSELRNRSVIPVNFSGGKAVEYILEELPQPLKEALANESPAP